MSHKHAPITMRPMIQKVHAFRSKVLGLAVLNGQLIAATERGIYIQRQNRWRKVKIT